LCHSSVGAKTRPNRMSWKPMNKNEPTGLLCNLVPPDREAKGSCMVHETPLFKIGDVTLLLVPSAPLARELNPDAASSEPGRLMSSTRLDHYVGDASNSLLPTESESLKWHLAGHRRHRVGARQWRKLVRQRTVCRGHSSQTVRLHSSSRRAARPAPTGRSIAPATSCIGTGAAAGSRLNSPPGRPRPTPCRSAWMERCGCWSARTRAVQQPINTSPAHGSRRRLILRRRRTAGSMISGA
jgi:hypothetical protein